MVKGVLRYYDLRTTGFAQVLMSDGVFVADCIARISAHKHVTRRSELDI